ncbi:hypothetical protein [Steroidobacter sp.]|uniref:hypothetical protein n=1 Tax=Steroidobacter sp. TaxID=1978227 RepID=UPI001A630229|nr:hypothetical protein [Steroidobacter sp.]MBL8271812.1 hypothetical protein [Steroidobacter sp.]
MSSQKLSNERFLVLSGHAPIHEFVRYIKTRSTDGQRADDVALTREWRQANARLKEAVATDPKQVEMESLEPLAPHLAKQADDTLAQSKGSKALEFLPHRWANVELDRLIVWQKYVNLGYANSIRDTLPPKPTDQQILQLAAGDRGEAPAVHVNALGSNSFAFSSRSNDLRVLGAVPLDPRNVSGYEPYGNAAAVLAVYVGYGVNVMWAVRMGNRVMLANGTHRAYALRAHGVTHVPCVVSEVTTRDDLDLLGLPEGAKNNESYFTRPRPPMLRDFFDERLCKCIPVTRNQHLIQLDLKFERLKFPAYQ